MVSLWKFDQFSKLNRLISDSLESSDEEATFFVKELEETFEKASSFFALLFDFPKPNSAHLQNLEKGIPIINETEYKVNADFIAEAKKVSNFLEIDEYYASLLVKEGMDYEKRLVRPIAECAILLFYSERQKFLLALDSIFSGGINNNAPELVKNALQNFANTLLSSSVVNSSGQGSNNCADDMFPTRILNTIETNKTFIDKLKLKDFSIAFSLGTEIASEVLNSLQDERRILASMYYVISSEYQLNSSELMSLINFFQKLEISDELTLKLVPSILTTLDSSVLVNVEPEYAEAKAIDKNSLLAADPNFLKSLDNEIFSQKWKEPELNGLIKLQWSLNVLFGIKRVSGFAEAIGYQEEKAEQLIEEAAISRCFEFASKYLLAYRQPELYLQNNGQNFLQSNFGTTSDLNNTNKSSTPANQISGTSSPYPIFVNLDDTITNALEYCLENLVTNYIIHSTSIIRKIKYNEEDNINKYYQQKVLKIQTEQYQGLYGSNRLQSSYYNSNDQATDTEPARHTESLFNFIAVLYKDRIGSSLRFWIPGNTGISEVDERLLTFVRWGMDMREQGMTLAYLKMLASLSNSPQAALCAHEFMVTAGGKLLGGNRSSSRIPFCSWDSLFSALDFYQQKLQQFRVDDISTAPEIPETEVNVINAFLDLLRNVVLNSISARLQFYNNSELQIMWILFNLLGCSVPTTLKGKIFGVLAAFCSPIPGNNLTEHADYFENIQAIHNICADVWQLMEQSQALQTMPENILANNSTMAWKFRGGIIYELEEIEAALGTFSETRGFLTLIDSLIHLDVDAVPLNNLERNPVIFSVSSPTIPSELGKDYRIPGINPYISFILDNIFGKSYQRLYKNDWEKWFIISKSLYIIEKCLATMVLPQSQGVFGINNYKSLITHPGFEICLRILCGAELVQTIFSVIRTGVDALNSAQGSTGGFMIDSTLSALRIIYKVLCLQNVILEVVIPELLESNSQELFDLPLSLPRSLTSVDNLLLLQSEIIVLIASYINTLKSSAICDASVKIIYALSHSTYFNSSVDELKTASTGLRIYSVNRLVQILSESQESDRIMHGYISRLEQEDNDFTEGIVDDSIGTSTEILSREVAYGYANGISDKLTQTSFSAVSLSIVELLISNIESNSSVPNIAHWLLGFSLQNTSKDDLPDSTSRLTCLHSVLCLLDQGTSHNQGEIRPCDQLIHIRPRLAQSCYRLIYILATNAITSKVFLRYIYKKEDFVSIQLQSLLSTSIKGVSFEIRSSLIDLIKSPTIENTIISLPELHPARIFSQLMSYMWLLQYSAHELHLASLTGKLTRINRIIDVLTQPTASAKNQSSQYSLVESFNRNSSSSIYSNTFLNLFKSIRDVYSDCLLSLNVRKKFVFSMFGVDNTRLNLESNELNNLAFQIGIDLEKMTTNSSSGCLIYDLHVITGIIRSSPNVEAGIDKNQANLLNARLLLVTCFFINLERELFFAYSRARFAWRQVAQIIATSSWTYIAEYKNSNISITKKAQLCNDMIAVVSKEISTLPPPYPIGLTNNSNETQNSDLTSLISATDEHRSIELSNMLSSIFVFYSKRLAQELTNGAFMDPINARSSVKGFNLYLEPTIQTWKNIVSAALSPNAQASMEIRTNIYSCMLYFLSAVRTYNSETSIDESAIDGNTQSSKTYSFDPMGTPSNRGLLDKSMNTPLSSGKGIGASNKSDSLTKSQKLVQRILEELTNSSIGEQLLECISVDALDGTDACKSISFSLLNMISALYSLEPRNRLILFLSRHNYIAQFVDALRREDAKLASLLGNNSESINSLFIYESIMSFLLRFSYRKIGAERIIESGIIEALCNLSFINLRPQMNSYTRDSQQDDNFSRRIERYNQMLTPVLNLLSALLTKVGKENFQLYEKVYKFMSLHYLPFEQILKEALIPNSVLTKQALNEIKSICLILCLLTKLKSIVDKSLYDSRAGILGIFNLYSPALSLLSRFSLEDNWLPYIQPFNEDDILLSNTQSLLLLSLHESSKTDNRNSIDHSNNANNKNLQNKYSLLTQQCTFIVRNIVINVLMTSYTISNPSNLVDMNSDVYIHKPFNPTLGWQIDNKSDSDQFPSICTMLLLLRQSLDRISDYQNLLNTSVEKVSKIASLSTQELKKLAASALPSSSDIYPFAKNIQLHDTSSFLHYPELPNDLSMTQLQYLAITALKRNKKESELQISLLIIALEQSLLLVYTHLDFYFNFDQSSDNDNNNDLGQNKTSRSYYNPSQHKRFDNELNI
ncbi:hypothetical protein BB561_003594 [Smittium simulii]|uniref:Uncharacterized protein n=1 Tax=Smittium simulii TaxID=133385 RepID=A0A2T9YKH8_9FUNG|nr:hypothetical protein BB561_003594 [Smittium simulii]